MEAKTNKRSEKALRKERNARKKTPLQVAQVIDKCSSLDSSLSQEDSLESVIMGGTKTRNHRANLAEATLQHLETHLALAIIDGAPTWDDILTLLHSDRTISTLPATLSTQKQLDRLKPLMRAAERAIK